MVLDNFSWQSACSVVFVSGGASVATDRRWPRNDGRADLRATDPRDLRATRRRTAPQAATVPEIGSTNSICHGKNGSRRCYNMLSNYRLKHGEYVK
jgi:hypothetical protein